MAGCRAKRIEIWDLWGVISKKIENFVNTGPYGSEIFKMLLPLQLWFFFNQTFPLNIPCGKS